MDIRQCPNRQRPWTPVNMAPLRSNKLPLGHVKKSRDLHGCLSTWLHSLLCTTSSLQGYAGMHSEAETINLTNSIFKSGIMASFICVFFCCFCVHILFHVAFLLKLVHFFLFITGQLARHRLFAPSLALPLPAR